MSTPTPNPDSHLIPASHGIATLLRTSQKIKLINTHGSQVIDTWILALPSTHLNTSSSRHTAPLYPSATPSSIPRYSQASNAAASIPEYMSMAHNRQSLKKLCPEVGDTLLSQKRYPMVKFIEDTSPGIHDTLVAACDRWRYAELGVEGYHRSCTDNFWEALDAFGTSPHSTLSAEEQRAFSEMHKGLGGRMPDPLNVFMNVPIAEEGKDARRAVRFEKPATKAGEYVIFEAVRDVVVVMSACPQDILATNGEGPEDAHFEILSEGSDMR